MACNRAGSFISNGSLDDFMAKKMQSMKDMDRSEPINANAELERQIKEPERVAPHPFGYLNQKDKKVERFDAQLPSSYSLEGNRNNMPSRDYEYSLFSSSLSDLYRRKMLLSSINGIYGHSIDISAPRYEEEEPLESLEEIEAQTIGDLLPDDDDLLAGVTDGLDITVQSGRGDDVEDIDLFSNIGGMDLGDDISSAEHKRAEYFGKNMMASNGPLAGKHLCVELASRTLIVRNINSNVEDSELHSLFEQYGDIHTLITTWKHRGFVMITYYDLRSACKAMKELQRKSLKNMKLDIHFSSPKDDLEGNNINHGLVAVYNYDSPISNDELHRVFGTYGEIKEIREISQPSPFKFIEFYDVRAAEAALGAINWFHGARKHIKVELTRPDGAQIHKTRNFSSKLEHKDFMKLISPPMNSAAQTGSVPRGTIGRLSNGNKMSAHSSVRAPFVETPFYHGISSSIPNNLESLVRGESFGMQRVPPTGLGHSPSHDVFPFNSSGSVGTNAPGSTGRILNRQLSGLTFSRHPMEMNTIRNGNIHHWNQYSWDNSPIHRHSSMMWPDSPSFSNGIHPQQRFHGLPRTPTHIQNPIMPVAGHYVGSAPVVNPSIWEMQHVFSGESTEGSAFHPGSLGNFRMSNSSLPNMEFIPKNVFSHSGGSFQESSMPSKEWHSHHNNCVMFPNRSSHESIRGRRNENVSGHTDKKQFELDIDRILRGEDSRTTLMIKNIPNKYTSKMLLGAIDERHKGTYDFLYLPIDFKNKCNVGYAFINMTEPTSIVPFYQAFNGKKWEKFNSEKVASIAYARIQGKAALVAHFQNSSLMNEDKRCRPILFHTDGPNAGDQISFPMGVNIRPRMSKTRASITNEDQGSPPSSANGEGFCGSNSSSGSARNSD